MKFTWEAHDIKSGRQFISCCERMIIGYDGLRGDDKYAAISLADGSIVIKNLTQEQLASHLNKWSAVPSSL